MANEIVVGGSPGDTTIRDDPFRPIDSGAKTGDGGGTMNAWSLTGSDRINEIVNLSYSKITNNTVRKIKKAGVTFIGNSMGGNVSDLGPTIKGRISDGEYFPIRGSVTLVAGDTTIAKKAINGEHIVNAQPYPQVLTGKNVDTTPPPIDAIYVPSGGVETKVDDISTAGYQDYQYTEVTGKVLDARGQPIQSDNLYAGASLISTDNRGSWRARAPTGKAVTFTGLNGTKQKDVTFPTRVPLEFQYGGIEVTVVDPSSGNAKTGVPVKIGEKELTTNENGKVVVTQLGLGQHTVTIANRFEGQVNVDFQGHLNSIRLEDLAGSASLKNIEVRVTDKQSGQQVEQIPAQIPELGIRTESDSNGRASVIHDVKPTDSPFTVTVGAGDARYDTREVTVDPANNPDRIDIEATPTNQTPNY